MGRPAKFTSEQILDAAQALVAERGLAGVTVADISSTLDAPSGSIYHRFPSRDLILAHLWIRTVRRAQEGFVAALEDPGAEAPVRAALHLVGWSRDHLDEARVLVLHRREDLAARWPEELGGELATLNDDIARSVRSYTRRRYGGTSAAALERVTFAVVDVPYAAVRRHLVAGKAPPPSVDGLVEAAVRHLLDLGG